MKTRYKGAILPLPLYVAIVWNDAMKYEYNKQKYIRVQRLMCIEIAKAFRISTKELDTLAGRNPIIIRTKNVVKQYNLRKGKGFQSQLIDRKMEIKKGHTTETLTKSYRLMNTRTKHFTHTNTGVRTSMVFDRESQNFGNGTSSLSKIQIE